MKFDIVKKCDCQFEGKRSDFQDVQFRAKRNGCRVTNMVFPTYKMQLSSN